MKLFSDEGEREGRGESCKEDDEGLYVYKLLFVAMGHEVKREPEPCLRM